MSYWDRVLTGSPWFVRAALAGLMAIALVLHLLGVRRDLPYVPEVDDHCLVDPAVRIAASGHLNPGWFGHPGSTVIYPLAAVCHIWNVGAHGGAGLPHDALETTVSPVPGECYLFGRLIAVGYSILSLPIAYQVGRTAFGPVAGLMGTWFIVLCPMLIDYAQQVRTDSACVFFTMLALWLCLRLYNRFTAKRSILAGVAVGLAVSTKYSLMVLAPFLFVVQMFAWRRGAHQRPHETLPQPGRLSPRRARVRSVVLGLLAAPLAFAATTPYFFLDYHTARENIRHEAPSTHLGADGLSPPQNFEFYLLNVIPAKLGRASTLLVLIATAYALWRRKSRQLLLLGFVAAYLVEVSLHPLHWPRWVIPIIPVLLFAAAAGLEAIVAELSGRFRLRPAVYTSLLVLGIVAISYRQAGPLISFVRQHARPSTRIQAREWVVQNLPAGSRIAQEQYTAALAGTSFDVQTRFSLATDRRVEDYSAAGYRYVSVSDTVYRRYFKEAERYPLEVAFYRDLFHTAHLLQQFEPSATRSGPTIRIYELRLPVDQASLEQNATHRGPAGRAGR